MRELGLGFTNPVGTERVLDVWLCFGCGGVGGVGREWLGGLDQGLEGLGGAMSMRVVSLDSLCRWQVQVSGYCAWRISAHLRCTQCSILLHLMDICFLTCMCLSKISQIQTRLFNVIGPGLVSTSTVLVKSSDRYPAGPHGRLAPQKTGKSGWYDTICTSNDKLEISGKVGGTILLEAEGVVP